ncbi:hypothetical protein BC629DRAFT_95729 [Irpex lacteus]|nr:hypothetical protein BC629DRAFT_95729 [Irpex lacteus]
MKEERKMGGDRKIDVGGLYMMENRIHIPPCLLETLGWQSSSEYRQIAFLGCVTSKSRIASGFLCLFGFCRPDARPQISPVLLRPQACPRCLQSPPYNMAVQNEHLKFVLVNYASQTHQQKIVIPRFTSKFNLSSRPRRSTLTLACAYLEKAYHHPPYQVTERIHHSFEVVEATFGFLGL